MISNPYAKQQQQKSGAAATSAPPISSAARDRTNTKRPQRPWEEATAAAAPVARTATTTTHTFNDRSNHLPRPLARNENRSVNQPPPPSFHAPPPPASTATAPASFHGNEKRNVNQPRHPPPLSFPAAATATSAATTLAADDSGFDPFDDCDIDWDAAVQQVEEKTSSVARTSMNAVKKTATTTMTMMSNKTAVWPPVLTPQSQHSNMSSGANHHPYNTSSSYSRTATASNTSATRENPYKKSSSSTQAMSTATTTTSCTVVGTNGGTAASSSSKSSTTIQNSPSGSFRNASNYHHHSSWSSSSPRPTTSYGNNGRQSGLLRAPAPAPNNAAFNNNSNNNSAVITAASHSVPPPPPPRTAAATAAVLVRPASSSGASSLVAPNMILQNNVPNQNPQPPISTHRPPTAPPTAAADVPPAPPQQISRSISTRPPSAPNAAATHTSGSAVSCSNAASTNNALAALRPHSWTSSTSSTTTAAALAVGPKRDTNTKMMNNTTGVKAISFLSSPSTNHRQQQPLQQQQQQQQQVQQQQPPPPPPPQLPKNQVGLPMALQFDPAEILPVTSDGHQKDLVRHADVSGTLLNGWTLFSHQKRAILKGLRMRRMILALDMGLGKTLTASVWANAFHKTMAAHIVVICPISVQHEWQRTFEQAIGLTVQDLNQKKSKKQKADKVETAPAVTIYSWAKVPCAESLNLDDDANQKFVVIADECHSIQSVQSARTKATLKLVLDSNCVGVMMLSGTPMKNGKPSNLFPLLRAVKNPLGKHQRAFEARFCEGREVQYGRNARPVWEAKGSSNLQQLKALADPHILHLPKEIIKDLPPKTRSVEHVPVSSRNHQKHQIALHELARIVAATKQTRSNNNNTGTSGDPVMGALSKLRKACSMAKVDAAVSRAKQILQNEPAVVIFTVFQEVAETICNHLVQAGWKGELLTGKTPSEKRVGIVDNFQSGISPVFVGTFGAAGAGITLHAARTIILVDRPWTPGDTFQAEDRVRRIGQKHAVTCIWLSAFELDKQMDTMIQHKDQTAKSVLESSSAPVPDSSSSWVTAGAPAPKISIDQLLKSLISDNSPSGHLFQTSMLKFSQADER